MSFLDDTGEAAVAPSPFINLMEILFPIPITNSLMGLFGDPKRLPAESRDALTAAKTARDKVWTTSIRTCSRIVLNMSLFAQIVSSIGARLTGGVNCVILTYCCCVACACALRLCFRSGHTDFKLPRVRKNMCSVSSHSAGGMMWLEWGLHIMAWFACSLPCLVLLSRV